MARKRIFYLISSLDQGGAERHLVELVRFLDPARFEPVICVLRQRAHFAAELPAGQPRYRLGHLWSSPRAFARLVAALRDARPDLVHTYLNDGNLWGRLAAQLAPRAPLLTSMHSGLMPRSYALAERLLQRLSDRVVAHSRSAERLLVQRVGLSPERITVIPNGIDARRFRPPDAAERRDARARFGLGDGDCAAVLVARISPEKNHHLLLEALGRLRRAGQLGEGFRLLLAGRVSSAAYARRLRLLVWRHGLGRVVRFCGRLPATEPLYHAADLALLPSQTEASPLAALEALACGVPVLISDAANTDEVVHPNASGWQVPVGNTRALADALRAAAQRSRAERRAMGQRGREHVLAHFTVQRVASDFARLYEALIARR